MSVLFIAAVPASVQAAPDPSPAVRAAEVVATLQDPRIVEASALVSQSGRPLRAYVVNDKGNAPLVYGVDLADGTTRGTVLLDGVAVVDLEALAEGAGGTLWVGDVGDNDSVRATIVLYRVPYPGVGDTTLSPSGVALRYPDGPHDAEALLVDRSNGARWVVTKAASGQVYRVPDDAGTDVTATLVPVGGVDVLPRVTDGVVLAGGRGVVLRGYRSAAVYDLPGWERVGTFPLPAQPQGEAIAQRGTGRHLLLTTEGQHPAVLGTSVPGAVWRRLG